MSIKNCKAACAVTIPAIFIVGISAMVGVFVGNAKDLAYYNNNKNNEPNSKYAAEYAAKFAVGGLLGQLLIIAIIYAVYLAREEDNCFKRGFSNIFCNPGDNVVDAHEGTPINGNDGL